MTDDIDLYRKGGDIRYGKVGCGNGEFNVRQGKRHIGEAAFWARGWCFIPSVSNKSNPTQFFDTPEDLRAALRRGEVAIPAQKDADLSFTEGQGKHTGCYNVNYGPRRLGRLVPGIACWRFFEYKSKTTGRAYESLDAIKQALREEKVWTQ